MDRPMIHRSSMPQSWSQQYPNPPQPNRPRPVTAPYPPHPQNSYAAPGLYPNVVGQQYPRGYPQPPVPDMLAPGGTRPRARSSVSDNNPYFDSPPPAPQFPSFPSPSPAQFPQGPPFPPIPSYPPNPPAPQHQPSGYPMPVTRRTQDELPIRPAPISARRSTSSPAINRLAAPDQPPPLPPLPPNYHSNYPQHPPQNVSPPLPPPSIPIPSLNQPYRPDSSPVYPPPFETNPPPFNHHPPHAASSSRIPTGSPTRSGNNAEQTSARDEEEALARAIALSEKESKEHSVSVSKEEDDLARAIEESMKHASSFGMPDPYIDAGPSAIPSTSQSVSFPAPLPSSESPLSSHMSLASLDVPRSSASRPASNMSSPLMYPVQQPSIEDDAAFALQLAEEERRAAAAEPSNPLPESPALPSTMPEVTVPQMQAPAPAPAPAPSPVSWKHQEAHRPRLSVVNSEPPPPLYHQVVSAQIPVPTKTSPVSPNKSPSLGRSSSASAVPSSSRLSPIPDKGEKLNGGRSQSLDTGSTSSSSSNVLSPPASTKLNSLSTVEESSDSPSMPSPSSSLASATLSTPNANSFVDQQLLDGVSLGFNPPQISTIKTTVKGGFPNVISLPTGKFVPFHIQAPDWRQLLKMMARLSGSRIEGSIEALASNKQELKLRTVVQFVRVNTTSEDWRTVIYLTIDHPPPSGAPHKFTNGDVNILPFSYTMSSLPALLRDGPDAPMSKYYSIPATTNTPYPTLPISFPNMAMYLASAVEDSRRMAHDSSSGMKRLAKTLDVLYPAKVEYGMEYDEPDKPTSGVMGMFKNVFGRGRKDQRRNDDNYADLVTPFVPEWH